MYYTIEIPFWLMFAFCFILGLSIGLGVNIWFLKPPRPKKPVDIYDGKHGQGYQPRPQPPKPQYNPNK